MSRLSTFMLGMAAGAGRWAARTNYDIIRAKDGLHVVAKQPARLAETYVDIRGFTMAEWGTHPQLASVLVQANQQQLLTDSAAGSVSEAARQLMPSQPNR